MRHHKKPEHYSTITELINQHKLDKRTAYKETVHNKLIKDKRFVLVGRGIYALAEWGYQPGVVSDMIKEILAENKAPMSRDQIIEEVLKRRLVKKNTILVGLSNKKMFEKVGKNLYTLVS
jgi:DNA-directed RNA polymerase delta subunit